MTTNVKIEPPHFYAGDCLFCNSAFSVRWVKKIRKQGCDKYGRDSRGKLIHKRPPPKTRKRYYRPSPINDLRFLYLSQKEWNIQKYADYRIETPRSPKKKIPINFSRCDECKKYAHCTNLCNRAKNYVYQDTITKYPLVAATVPDLQGKTLDAFLTNPESAPNLLLDIIFQRQNGIEELVHLFIAGSFIDPEIEALYRQELYDAFKKRKLKRCVTPAFQIQHSKALWILYLYFKKGKKVRDIARRLDASPGYVSDVVNLHRRILENHLSKVFARGTRRNYFYEKYFNQRTVTQISKIYGVSHQAVSKSIRRTSRKILKSLKKAVADSQYIGGDRDGFLFSRGAKKIVVDKLHV